MDLFRPQLEVLNLIFLIGFFIQIQNKTLHSTDNLKIKILIVLEQILNWLGITLHLI